MIIGFVEIDQKRGLLHVKNDSYALLPGTSVSVSRPMLATGCGLGVGLVAFAASFIDLLYAHELGVSTGSALIIAWAGSRFAQLTLINRELRGTEQSVAIYGTYHHLNKTRREIAEAASAAHEVRS